MKGIKVTDTYNNKGTFANIEDAKIWGGRLENWGHEVTYTECELTEQDIIEGIEKWENAQWSNQMANRMDFDLDRQYKRFIENLKK